MTPTPRQNGDTDKTGASYQDRPRTFGFRFSLLDAFVIIATAVVTACIWNVSDGVGLLPLFVVLHFFLFCNVFRIRRPPELVWAASFTVLAATTYLLHNGTIWPAYLIQAPVTVFLLIRETKKPCYHGILARKINPHLDTYLGGKI